MPRKYPQHRKHKRAFHALPAHLQDYKRPVTRSNTQKVAKAQTPAVHADLYENYYQKFKNIVHEYYTDEQGQKNEQTISKPNTRSNDVYNNKTGKIPPSHTHDWYFSQAAYNPDKYEKAIARLGYVELEETMNDKTMKAYVNQGNHIVFANRGSAEKKDFALDALKGWGPLAYINPAKFASDARVKYDTMKALKIMESHPGYSFSATGHSLGGTMAAHMGYAFDIPYTAFNPGAADRHLQNHFRDAVKNGAAHFDKPEKIFAANGTVYRYGKDVLSRRARDTYVNATHHNIKGKNFTRASDHSIDNFAQHLDDDVVQTAGGTLVE